MRGYFGIGVYKPKTVENIGTLWRTAYQMGASFIFTIEKRYTKQCSDTYKAYRHIPLFQFKDFKSFVDSRLYNCRVICIEFNDKSVPLKDFKHPEACVYLLGAEDGGLPKEITDKYDTIELPSVRTPSYNVAISGALVMFDRLNKINMKSINQ